MQTEREIKEDKEEVNLIYLCEQQHGEHTDERPTQRTEPSEVQEAASEFNQPGL